MFKQALVLVTFALLVIGCSKTEQQATEVAGSQSGDAMSQPMMPAGHPPIVPASTEGAVENQGVVISHISVAGYSYIEVHHNGSVLWVAGNPVNVAEGDVIAWKDAAMMTNFHSKTLDRTFDRILFAGSIYKPSGESQPTPGNSGRVVSVQNAASYSYLEIEAESGTVFWLAAPEVKVSVDDRVTWEGGNMMSNFKSSSLDRTFDEILFVSGVSVQDH